MGPFRDAASTKTAIRNYPSDDIGQNTYTEYAIQMIKTQFTEPRLNEGLREGAVRVSFFFLFCLLVYFALSFSLPV